jgi:hypothetical protein
MILRNFMDEFMPLLLFTGTYATGLRCGVRLIDDHQIGAVGEKCATT